MKAGYCTKTMQFESLGSVSFYLFIYSNSVCDNANIYNITKYI